MVEANGIRVAPDDAESTRKRLVAERRLRRDLAVTRSEGAVVFPITDGEGDGVFEFPARDVRPADYTGYLTDWPADALEAAPRAFEQLGDVAIIKVPPALWRRRHDIGEALRRFTGTASAWHDHGVVGLFRTRDLEHLAGDDSPRTTVNEHGCRLTIDVTKAYYSPRLATERSRVVATMQPGERVVDLFCGVAPLLVQAGAAVGQSGHLVGVDLNPDAINMGRDNCLNNGVSAELHCGDAREVADQLAPAHHVVMNLPHDAAQFLDVAAPLVLPGGLLHYHEILDDAELSARTQELLASLAAAGGDWAVHDTRTVRTYAPGTSHMAIDFRRSAP